MLTSPLISVIVIAHDRQGGLEGCLQSILCQSFKDVEVVVVADESPECRPAVVEAFARSDERVSLVRLDGVVGVGRVRNAGADRATGRYLLFLDTDHILWDGTLQAMADRLRTCDEPDVLLLGHTRLHKGRSWPGAAAELLAGLDSRPFDPADRPELLGAPAYVWDRLIRRDFWAAQALSFPEGLHEEVAVVHRALLAADRVAALKWDCVQIRRRHTQHPAGSPGATHFDVFDRYEESFGLLGEYARTEAAPFLFTRMVRHHLFLLHLSGCLARSERPQFFRRASEQYQRFVPGGYERPQGREGVKFQLVAGGGYGAFQSARIPQLARGVLSRP
ncbi:glycosyltransferase family 2 protein [Streptacidiphilus rugosus]|uniref:glycosyltransferase family 2 protein n=1 Tax=Streptacidiphilus rugosus TaxID=405783 RepID=UPI0009FEF28E|nr:glycosyltransferase [Streptacidiphilus rugosus]